MSSEIWAAVATVLGCLGLITLWWAVRKYGEVAVEAARAYVMRYNNDAVREIIETGITWAEARLKDLDGPAKMVWVLDYLRKHKRLVGVEITEKQVEYVYQQLRNMGMLP